MNGPLAGLRVVVTRPVHQSAALIGALQEVGALADPVPVIDIVGPADGGAELRSGLASLSPGDWLVMTSPNGAVRVAEALGGDPLPEGVKVAVVGPGTRARAEAHGMLVDLTPNRAIAEGLVEAFPPPPPEGGRVVLARAEIAREVLPQALTANGWTVDEVIAYRTVPVAVSADGRERCLSADAVVFTSASTVSGLVAEVGVAGLPPVVASIGPATSQRAAELGVAVDVEASTHTIPGVVEALVAHFRSIV